MIIGIDGNEANVNNRVGVNEYAYELLCNMYKLLSNWHTDHRLIVYLQQKPNNNMPEETKFWQYRVLPGKGKWILTKLSPNLRFSRIKPDVFFTPSHYIPPLVQIPRVCSIMDLGYLKFPEQFRKGDFWQLKLWSAYSIKASKKIFAISHSTKQDIVRHYPFASKKITVTHLGFNKRKYNTNIPLKDVRRIKEKYSIVNDYCLFISMLKPSKNIEGLLHAWALVVAQYPQIKLIIAGRKGWLYESIFEKVEDMKLGNSVIFTGYVPEEDKPALISGAKALVLPSFWEGFGFDPLYALACGVPAVVSDVASLPEVVGDAGILINPNQTDTIAKGILDVIGMNEVQYKQLVRRGLKQAEKFSWEETARITLKQLETI